MIGLLLTGLWGGFNPQPSSLEWVLVVGAIAVCTALAAVLLPRVVWSVPAQFWLVVGIVALVAVGYFQMRVPRAQADQIYALAQDRQEILQHPVQITGKILSTPVLNSNQKIRFTLQLQTLQSQEILVSTQGKLYVTVLPTSNPLHPGQLVSIKGDLYQPQPTAISWKFDFAKYLARQGIFLGCSGWDIDIIQDSAWGLWRVRQRIQNVHQKLLDQPIAKLMSSMVLDRRSVDLSYEIQDLFIRAGLAHTIAASGFHVSLLLGITLWLLRQRTEQEKSIIGTAILVFYAALTGFQASILRATLMGIGGLIGLVFDRRVKPLSLLILVATILLIYDPLFIWDVGFQLSFLATFGLMTTLKPIEKYLDFVPPAIATTIAIPVAASLWTIPLIAYNFNVIATYSILTSILLSPLIVLVSLGGMISGAIGLVWPPLGSAIAYGTGFPLSLMVWVVRWIVKLPGSNWTIGQLTWGQLSVFYGVMLAMWLHPWAKRHIRLLSISLVSLFMLFLIHRHFNTTQITVLATKSAPTIVLQASGKAVVLGDFVPQTVQYDLIPFLRQAGINQIDAAVAVQAMSSEAGWLELAKSVTIKQKFVLIANQPTETELLLPFFQSHSFGDIRINLLQNDPYLLGLTLKHQTWYWLGLGVTNESLLQRLTSNFLIVQAQDLDLKLWQMMKPVGAIAIGSSVGHPFAPNSIVRWTGEQGIIQWTPQQGIFTPLPERF